MSELGDLLELLYRANGSFSTVRGELREWRDLELGERAREALMQREQRHGGGGQARTVMLYGQAGGDEERPAQLESSVRFWFEQPQRVREEWRSAHRYGQDGVVGVRDGERWWRYDPRSGAVSNQDEPEVGSGIGQWLEQLTDPVDLLAGLDLEIEGRSEQAGRAAIVVDARPRLLANPVVHHFPHGADVYRFHVDRERGILLRRAMLFKGAELQVSEILELAFDEPFPPRRSRSSCQQGRRSRTSTPTDPTTSPSNRQRHGPASLSSRSPAYPKETGARWSSTSQPASVHRSPRSSRSTTCAKTPDSTSSSRRARSSTSRRLGSAGRAGDDGTQRH